MSKKLALALSVVVVIIVVLVLLNVGSEDVTPPAPPTISDSGVQVIDGRDSSASSAIRELARQLDKPLVKAVYTLGGPYQDKLWYISHNLTLPSASAEWGKNGNYTEIYYLHQYFWVSENYRIKLEQTLAVGDNHNMLLQIPNAQSVKVVNTGPACSTQAVIIKDVGKSGVVYSGMASGRIKGSPCDIEFLLTCAPCSSAREAVKGIESALSQMQLP